MKAKQIKDLINGVLDRASADTASDNRVIKKIITSDNQAQKNDKKLSLFYHTQKPKHRKNINPKIIDNADLSVICLPCRYVCPGHNLYWINYAGQVVCAICHPPALPDQNPIKSLT